MVRVLVAAALAPLALIVPLVAMFGAVGVAPIILWLVVLLRTWAYVSLRLELRADAAAHGDVGGETYARALERLYEVNLIPAVISGTKTHPCLYDRMLAAGVEPSYPRPEPPAASVPRRALFASIAISRIDTSYVRLRPCLRRKANARSILGCPAGRPDLSRASVASAVGPIVYPP